LAAINLDHNPGQPENDMPLPVSMSLASASDAKPGSSAVVSVCTACRATPADAPTVGEMMLATLTSVLLDQMPAVTVRAVRCLGVCKRPATVAVSAREGYTFVFGDLALQDGPAAIATFVKSYREMDYGFVPWKARPELLRTRLVARIPSVLWSPQDGQPPA
jgi:predicted metal-binding protein